MGDCNAYEFCNAATMADCNAREFHKDGERNATTIVDCGAPELRNDGECNLVTMANCSARELCNNGERNAAMPLSFATMANATYNDGRHCTAMLCYNSWNCTA